MSIRASLIREPLLHFLVLGGLLYFATTHLSAGSPRYRIDAGPEKTAQLAATYQQQYGVVPTAEQLRQLLDQYVRSEILYREGLAMGLERDDEIVRRRIVQKIEFVNEDVDVQGQPADAQLQRYFQSHQERYSAAPTISFQHIFVSVDDGGDTVARSRAQRILKSLKRDPRADAAALGDPFAEGLEFNALSRVGANALFGDSQLSEALFERPASANSPAASGEWSGPYRSAYGWHLVRVTHRQGTQPATFETVRSRVTADYTADLREQRNLAAFRWISRKYQVVTGGPSA